MNIYLIICNDIKVSNKYYTIITLVLGTGACENGVILKGAVCSVCLAFSKVYVSMCALLLACLKQSFYR